MKQKMAIWLALISMVGMMLAPVPASGAPTSAVDESKVPHYFGPYPNWANSPLTLPDAQVVITGNGTGATAEATVGANGAITAITITNGGQGYSNAKAAITGSGTGAQADLAIVKKGAVVSVSVTNRGGGYTEPSVSFSGNRGATATAYGAVDSVDLPTPGTGYKFPTVDFDMPDDPNGVQARGHAVCAEPYPTCDLTNEAGFLTVTGVVVDSGGSGYATAPNVVVRDGTQFEPINHGTDPFTAAVATATLNVESVVVDNPGTNYGSTPTVTIRDLDGTGTGATATATLDNGVISSITVKKPGSGYIKLGGIKKFQDTLPGLCDPAGAAGCPADGKYIPLAVPEVKTYNGVEADEYVIGLVQYRTSFSSSLPNTLVRGYIQLETPDNFGISQHFPVTNELLGGTVVPVMKRNSDGTPSSDPWYAVTEPQWLGPTIVAQKDRPVRIVFYNLLPDGADGDLFLPTDSSLMGSGMGPMGMADPFDEGVVTDEVRNPICTESKAAECFKDNRATLHLHGGITPWISDGTPHQWITPAGEGTAWPEGVSVQNVPDMDVCNSATDGCQTFYYTNQQSARFMFYHDHAWGITRLNVYAGEAAGYIITDDTEQKLFGPTGTYASMGEGIPLVIQDRTFVPSVDQLEAQDPTWDTDRWGGMGNFWYHHVYMPAQNPGDPSGMSAFGRWMYGPWFWPPATPQHGPIANPYYNMDPATGFTTPKVCNLDDPSTWQYQVEPFCEPAQIPGTPNISVGMEQFNDTPIVNGTAYPTTTLEPKSYRFRILNAANDRFWNLSWYVADSTGTEVALKASEVAAAQTDINIVPTPDTNLSPAGPDWIQIGSEGGFLPAPVIVPAQPTTWITDPTRFDVGNVDKHSMLLAPAERSDVIVDFSKFAGKTLILYNDAPAAFPARVPSYDYYTGAPDTGAGVVLPGYGPNTRTIMQVKIASSGTAPAFNLTALNDAFKHHADGSGVFESGQHPIIVGQAAYNSAYGTSFAASGNCTDPIGNNKCDGFARINQQGYDLFRFDNLLGSDPQLTIPLQPKALHDEMNSAAFDEFGRMTANLGLEAVPATPGLQNILLYPFIAPPTEVIDGTNLPKNDIAMTPVGPIASADGTQIWKITHNGVDTHPIHWHLYDLQVLNRVTWDNIIIPPDASELGWKDTVRISPLEDTYVALRPIIPWVPFEVPNSVRTLNPMMEEGANLDPNGLIVGPDGIVTTLTNALVNFGWEYVYHCHILSHEEMDMMRPVLMALPPFAANGLAVSFTGNQNVISWNDNSITETSFILQKSVDGITWTNVATSPSPLNVENTRDVPRSLTDTQSDPTAALLYRVVARNTVGYGGAYPQVNADSFSATLELNLPTEAPAAPTDLVATLEAGPQVRLEWLDNATNEGGFVIERAIAVGGPFVQIAVAPASSNIGPTSFTDTTIATGTPYWYRVAAVNLFGGVATLSDYSNTVTTNASPAVPAAPSNLAATNGGNQGNKRSVNLTWIDNSGIETGFTIEWATNTTFTTGFKSMTVSADMMSATLPRLSKATTYYVRIRADNATGSSAWVNATPFPIVTIP